VERKKEKLSLVEMGSLKASLLYEERFAEIFFSNF
jgi:hypothetical protein